MYLKSLWCVVLMGLLAGSQPSVSAAISSSDRSFKGSLPGMIIAGIKALAQYYAVSQFDRAVSVPGNKLTRFIRARFIAEICDLALAVELGDRSYQSLGLKGLAGYRILKDVFAIYQAYASDRQSIPNYEELDHKKQQMLYGAIAGECLIDLISAALPKDAYRAHGAACVAQLLAETLRRELTRLQQKKDRSVYDILAYLLTALQAYGTPRFLLHDAAKFSHNHQDTRELPDHQPEQSKRTKKFSPGPPISTPSIPSSSSFGFFELPKKPSPTENIVPSKQKRDKISFACCGRKVDRSSDEAKNYAFNLCDKCRHVSGIDGLFRNGDPLFVETDEGRLRYPCGCVRNDKDSICYHAWCKLQRACCGDIVSVCELVNPCKACVKKERENDLQQLQSQNSALLATTTADCAICLQTMGPSDSVIVLQCGDNQSVAHHVFHDQCLKDYESAQGWNYDLNHWQVACPLCRATYKKLFTETWEMMVGQALVNKIKLAGLTSSANNHQHPGTQNHDEKEAVHAAIDGPSCVYCHQGFRETDLVLAPTCPGNPANKPHLIHQQCFLSVALQKKCPCCAQKYEKFGLAKSWKDIAAPAASMASVASQKPSAPFDATSQLIEKPTCPICYEDYTDETIVVLCEGDVTKPRHVMCATCFSALTTKKCPTCAQPYATDGTQLTWKDLQDRANLPVGDPDHLQVAG